MSKMFSSEISDVAEFHAKNSSSKSFDGDDILGKGTTYSHEEELAVSGEIDSVSSDFGFDVENIARDEHLVSKRQEEHQQESFAVADIQILDNLYLDVPSSPFQSSREEKAKLPGNPPENLLPGEPQKEKKSGTPFAALGILKSHGNGFRRLKGEKIKVPAYGASWTQPNVKGGDPKLATVDILRLAGEKFVQHSSQMVDDGSTSCHPFGSSFLNLSNEESKDVGLVHSILAAAEKVGLQQYNRAGKLLSRCDELSSDTGNPVQKLVYYFSEALREKIEKATGRFMSKRLEEKQMFVVSKAMRSLDSPSISFHNKVPFAQICELTGMQAIIEHVADAKKIRLIDLDIRSGIQCIVLMQALAARSECPVEILKITAIGTDSKSAIEETGKRLLNFAQSINLPLCFSVVMVSDMLDLKEYLFDIEAEEVIAVNSSFLLRVMLSKPNQLESLMRVLRSINPCLMVVTEVEANHNSPVFVNRFIEALFFFGAYLDCLEDCMDQSDPIRKISESVFFAHGIRNTVAAEGEERIARNVNISVWRAFFARYGMMEEELSTASIYQANLVAKNFSCGSSCSFNMDGNSLIIGWKGTPLHSVSAWNSSRECFKDKIINVAGFQAKNSSSKSSDGDDGVILGKCSFIVENIPRDGYLVSKCQEEHQQDLFLDFEFLDYLYLDVASPPLESCHEEIAKHAGNSPEILLSGESQTEKQSGASFASLAILKSYGNGFKRLKGETMNEPTYGASWTEPNVKVGDRKLSTVDILRLAGEKFVEHSSQMVDDGSTSCHPFGSSFLNLSDEESKDAVLVQSLLAAAEKVGQQQYSRASKLLSLCEEISSDTGNPVQKLVYYFSEALRAKIEKATEGFMSARLKDKHILDLNKAMRSADSPLISFHGKVPFGQICEVTGMQIIIEHVAVAKKIRLVDLDIRSGMQCIVLMQALAARSECPIEILKITAVGTDSKSAIEDTGKRLLSFAESINLPLCFSVVMVSDMLDLKEDLFDLEAEEVVAVNSSFLLRIMLPTPNLLESLMRVLRSINPCVLVVSEVEANHNSSVFSNRFIEALFFFGAYFDCLEHCMDQSDPIRKFAESVVFAQGIWNKVAVEGEERTSRSVNISVWRAFFARYGMVEEELSTTSCYQANLVAKKFSCGSSCTFDMDVNSLIIGWKGTPLHSVSAWKFH